MIFTRSFSCLFTTALGLAAAAASTSAAFAKPGDMRVGIHEGEWCGLSAQFRVETKRGDTWKFDGQVLIHQTNEIDRLTIEQYENNSLYIRRYLSGPHSGKRQWSSTHPPRFSEAGNRGMTAHFDTKARGGFGCSGPTYIKISPE